MKIVLIGPLPPYRGGIAHSNEMLYRNVSKKHEVKTVSFKRLYPKIFYPGKFQADKNTENNGTLDSVNPLNWIKAVMEINDFKPDFVIFQWWTTFLVPCYSFLASAVKAKKIAICQNIFPHKEGGMKGATAFVHEAAAKFFLSKMDRLVAMSKADLQELTGLFQEKKTGLYLEPMYEIDGINGNFISREKAKKMLGLEGKNVLLFFGFVREYKGLKYLIEAMPEIAEKTGAQLLIVGEFWEKKEKYLEMIERLGLQKNISILDQYVPNKEVPKYFLAADLLVLPYISISESGVIRMAFNFNTPILSTNVGGNSDHIESGFNGFLVEPGNSSAIAQKATEFFGKKMFSKMSKGMKEKRKELEWNAQKEKEILGV